MASFRITLSDGEARTEPLRRRITTIGAADDCDLRIDEPGVADRHATVTLGGTSFTLRAADGSVSVDGDTIDSGETLQHGDVVDIGECRLEFQLLGSPTGASDAEDDAIRRRLEGFEHIHRLSTTLLGRYDAALDELFEDLIDSAIELTGAAKGFLLLADDGQWHIQVARNVEAESLDDGARRLSDSVLRRVVDSHRPLIVADARSDDEFGDAQSVIDLQLSSVLCVPLLDGDELLGIIYVGNDEVIDQFDQIDLELLSIFAAKLSLLLSNAIFLDDLRSDRRRLKERLEQRRFGSLVGASEAMEPVFHAVDRVAPTDVTVLITGETGTGKELVAEELHRRSNRSDGPFVTLNCGAIPESLLESELFGHEKGAFTGADSQKDGKFHAADGGTIFLDEIGEMPLDLQVKLLRVLQERAVSRVGSNEEIDIDIRILAATNRNLENRVDAGEFREDLYYRLNVIEIALPPLRKRDDDIELLANYLVDHICDELGVETRELSSGAVRAMRKYHWPGNVRQLENRLKKALVLATGSKITADDLDLGDGDSGPALKPLAEAKEEFATEYVMDVLERNDGNRSQTARDLDVDPRTVFRYLEKAPS